MNHSEWLKYMCMIINDKLIKIKSRKEFTTINIFNMLRVLIYDNLLIY